MQMGHQAGYTAVVCVLVCAINIFGVKWFGESEFIFSIIKRTSLPRSLPYQPFTSRTHLTNFIHVVLLITGLILVGLIIDLGGGPDHQRKGFQYWRNPGAFAGAGLEPDHIGLDRFLGMLNVLVQAGFSFQGLELTAVYVNVQV